MKKICYGFLLIMAGLTGCTLDDRIDDLTSGYKGAFINKLTGDTVATEYYGAKIRLLDLKYGNRALPIEYDVKPSGAYESAQVFPSDYKIYAVGPFFELDTIYSDLSDHSVAMDLKVMPNCEVTIKNVEQNGPSSVAVTFSYQVYDETSANQEIGLVYGTASYPGYRTAMDENQSNATTKKRIKENLTDLQGEFTEVLTLTPGTKYYIRALGKTATAGDYWNYSKQVEIQLP